MVLLLTGAFGAGLLTQRAMEPDSVGLAPDSVVRLIDANVGALNTGSSSGLAATFADKVVFTDMQTGEQRFGRTRVLGYLLGFKGVTVERTSGVIYRDGYATFTIRFGDGSVATGAVETFEIEHGQITHEWIMADTPGGFEV